jgi:hypothetical protein
MKNYVIGIAGKANSGKDTVASIINYIFHVGLSKATYQDWIINQVSYDNTNKHKIFHFADPLKDVLSIIYNIPRYLFNDRCHKDDKYYNMKTGRFEFSEVVENMSNVDIITSNKLKSFTINQCIDWKADKQVFIKLRTLLQYFGTDVCRKHLDESIWIKSAIYKIIDIAETYRICLVPDVRFANEAKALTINEPSLYGQVIEVRRDSCKNSSHASEIIDFKSNIIIDNNGNKMQLFYKVLTEIQKII